MNKTNLIYKRIIEKISENNGFDELVIYDIENIYGCSSIRTKDKKRKQQRINKAKQRLKNFDNNLYLTKNSLVIIKHIDNFLKISMTGILMRALLLRF